MTVPIGKLEVDDMAEEAFQSEIKEIIEDERRATVAVRSIDNGLGVKKDNTVDIVDRDGQTYPPTFEVLWHLDIVETFVKAFGCHVVLNILLQCRRPLNPPCTA